MEKNKLKNITEGFLLLVQYGHQKGAFKSKDSLQTTGLWPEIPYWMNERIARMHKSEVLEDYSHDSDCEDK